MSEYKRTGQDITLIQLSNYVKPEVIEYIGRKWVLNGVKNFFPKYVNDRKNGSPTSGSIINVYCRLLYGKGIAINGQDEIYEELVEIFSKKEQKKCLKDFETHGYYFMEILRSAGDNKKVAKIMHLPVDKMGRDKINDKGKIKGAWYSYNWNNTTIYKPEFIPEFQGELTAARMVKSVVPYESGQDYFKLPSYVQGLQYAELEEEISNFSINHIKNGLSFGYIINFNNGAALSNEEKDEIERKIKKKLTGSTRAGNFIISFNDGKEVEVTIVALEVSEAHQQFEFLSKESMTKILTAHGVTSPLLFGLPSAGGFGANAEELDTASKLLQDYQINPKQETFIDELASIITLNGLETDLVVIPLRETYKSTEEVKDEPTDETIDEEVELSKHFNIDSLIELGEDINYDNWDLVEDERCDEINLSETELNTIFEFAQVPKTSKKNSTQDTSLFKIRYRYAGKKTGDREFCIKVLLANKVYRAEDLNANFNYNEEFATTGKTTYNIFNYKGGVNCKHWWQRVILLKKGNTQISVNQAQKMILKLKPSERKAAKWVKNDPKVAVIADKSNNFWSLKPNYRDSGIT